MNGFFWKPSVSLGYQRSLKLPNLSYRTGTQPQTRMYPKDGGVKDCTPTYPNPPHPQTSIGYVFYASFIDSL